MKNFIQIKFFNRKSILKAVSGSSGMEGLSLERARKNEGVINALKNAAEHLRYSVRTNGILPECRYFL
ncbi:hypothetical protein HZA43_00030 [Candidatus Peregrinibacteria bacterium]|nr:hypothetical protein [Candidatus Peregrinibacteria bacterium]